NKPLIIHTRNSSQQTLDVLKSVGAGKVTGIMHCFVEDKDIAQQALDIGFYLSFSGISTFKNAILVQDVMQWAPLDRLLIETDAPYLAPVPYRGKLNEPAYVAKVGEQMAKLKGISVESLAEQLEQNAQRLFRL
ncbi:MAG TPA: TatD family hydrolase, partial [Thiotrichales bacterium]|nr:TatD family hydrolase [Thiotrichales bacterium]